MRRRLARLSLLVACAAHACAPLPRDPVANDAPLASAPDASPAPAVRLADGKPFFLFPADFQDGVAKLNLLPAKGGKSILIAVPALSVRDYRQGSLMDRVVPIRVAVSGWAPGATATAGTPLPPPSSHAAPPIPSAIVTATNALPPSRGFQVYEPKTRTYVAATGRRAFVGGTYAFYEDTKNANNLTPTEYGVVEGHLGTWYPKLVDLFGPPTDIDGNGHHIVFVSRTVVDTHGPGAASVDACNLDPANLACGDHGEVIYFPALDGFPNANGQRDFFAGNYFPRNVLHETVHLSQFAAAMAAKAPLSRLVLPAFHTEGQAQLMGFVTRIGDDDMWSELGKLLLRGKRTDTPFRHPYVLGGLFFWWLHQHDGAAVQRDLLQADLDASTQDPIGRAVGVPEPLSLAMMYAALTFDETEYGRTTGLELPLEDIPRRLGKEISLSNVSPARPGLIDTSYTGYAGFEIDHTTPVAVTIACPKSESAYVVVAQP